MASTVSTTNSQITSYVTTTNQPPAGGDITGTNISVAAITGSSATISGATTTGTLTAGATTLGASTATGLTVGSSGLTSTAGTSTLGATVVGNLTQSTGASVTVGSGGLTSTAGSTTLGAISGSSYTSSGGSISLTGSGSSLSVTGSTTLTGLVTSTFTPASGNARAITCNSGSFSGNALFATLSGSSGAGNAVSASLSGATSTGIAGNFTTAGVTSRGIVVESTNTGTTATLIRGQTTRSANSAFKFLDMLANGASQFSVDGVGNLVCAGSFTPGSFTPTSLTLTGATATCGVDNTNASFTANLFSTKCSNVASVAYNHIKCLNSAAATVFSVRGDGRVDCGPVYGSGELYLSGNAYSVVENTNTGYTSSLMFSTCANTTHTAYKHIDCQDSSLVSKFSVRGDGRVTTAENLQLGSAQRIVWGYQWAIAGYNAENLYFYYASSDAHTEAINSGTAPYINRTNNQYTLPSDIRVKQDIENIPYGLKDVCKLRPVHYRMKRDPKAKMKMAGLIAQEVVKIMPEMVSGSDQGSDHYGISYAQFVPVLIKAIQELKAEVDVLKAQLAKDDKPKASGAKRKRKLDEEEE